MVWSKHVTFLWLLPLSLVREEPWELSEQRSTILFPPFFSKKHIKLHLCCKTNIINFSASFFFTGTLSGIFSLKTTGKGFNVPRLHCQIHLGELCTDICNIFSPRCREIVFGVECYQKSMGRVVA